MHRLPPTVAVDRTGRASIRPTGPLMAEVVRLDGKREFDVGLDQKTGKFRLSRKVLIERPPRRKPEEKEAAGK